VSPARAVLTAPPMNNLNPLSRRTFLKGASGAAALGTLVAGMPSTSCVPTEEELAISEDSLGGNGFGLTITQSDVFEGRLHYFRFATQEIGWQPAVNVLLPEDYFQTSWRRYPVLYLLHGGLQDFRKFHMEDDIVGLTRGRRLIVVMPDGGAAGWYCNPVRSFSGPRNWESFHMNQLIPWVDANFRTFAEYDGRAISGFSMGGFGALKYTAKYYGHFASVSRSAPSSPSSAAARCTANRSIKAWSPPTTPWSASTASATASASSWSAAWTRT
jgi:S-formylglutathione hydrolase FrmB